MGWEKSSPELIALFEAVCPDPPVQPRKMFGYPCAFLNGNMFLGLFRDQLWLRLGDADRAELMAAGGSPFEPVAGQKMREYVVTPTAWRDDLPMLTTWVERARTYAEGLAPKRHRRTPQR